MRRFIFSLLLLPLIGCGGGTPKVKEAAPPAEDSDASVIAARDQERQRRRTAASNTILTGAQGDTSQASTAVKSLLGA